MINIHLVDNSDAQKCLLMVDTYYMVDKVTQPDRPKVHHVTNNYNGANQPHYGNQYNTDHLTLAIPSQGTLLGK